MQKKVKGFTAHSELRMEIRCNLRKSKKERVLSGHYSCTLMNGIAAKEAPAVVPGPRGPHFQLRLYFCQKLLGNNQRKTREWTLGHTFLAASRAGDLSG